MAETGATINGEPVHSDGTVGSAPCGSCAHPRSLHSFDAQGNPKGLIDNLYGRGTIWCDSMSWAGSRREPILMGSCGCEGFRERGPENLGPDNP